MDLHSKNQLDNFYSLLLWGVDYDLSLLGQNLWMMPILKERALNSLMLAGSLELFDNVGSNFDALTIDVESGVAHLDTSVTEEDASNEPVTKRPSFDSSFTLQPSRNYSNVFSFPITGGNSVKFFNHPFLKDSGEIVVDDHRVTTVEKEGVATNYIIGPITADLAISCDIDTSTVVTNPPINTTIDSSSTYGVYSNYYDEKPIADWYRTLYVYNNYLPVGLTFYTISLSGVNKIKLATPSLGGGLSFAEYLEREMLKTAPEAMGMGMFGAACLNHNLLLELALKDFSNLQRFYSKNNVIAGIPDKLDRFWNRSSLTQQRSLRKNALFGLFSLGALRVQPSIEKAYCEQDFAYLASLFTQSVDQSIGLAIKGYSEVAFSVLDLDYSASILICLFLSEFLQYKYDSKYQIAASRIYNEVLKFRTYLEEIIENEDEYFFFLCLYWFGDYFDLEDIKTTAIEQINAVDYGGADTLTQGLAWYTSEIKGDFSYTLSTVEWDTNLFSKPKSNEDVNVIAGNNNLVVNISGTLYNVVNNELITKPSTYISSLNAAINSGIWFLGEPYRLRAQTANFSISKAEATAKKAMPISEEWFKKEDVYNGTIADLIENLVTPNFDFYINTANISNLFDVDRSYGPALENLSKIYGNKRRSMEHEKVLRKRLRLDYQYKGSKEKDILNWLDGYGLKGRTRFNKIPSNYYVKKRVGNFIVYDYKVWESFLELKEDALYSIEWEGRPGIYALDDESQYRFLPWEKIVGLIEVSILGYDPWATKKLKQMAAAGIRLEPIYIQEFNYDNL